MERDDIIPIPLRRDFTAHVQLPPDLTPTEAEKIARVVLAYASPSPTSEGKSDGA